MAEPIPGAGVPAPGHHCPEVVRLRAELDQAYARLTETTGALAAVEEELLMQTYHLTEAGWSA